MILKQNPPGRLRETVLDGVAEELQPLVVEKIDDHAKLRDEGDSLFIFGPEGSGKSGVIAHIHNELGEQGWLLQWLDCNLWPDNFEESKELVNTIGLSQALLIDDLGREPAGMRKYMAKLLNIRFTEGLLTYMTSNLNVDPESRDACELTDFYSAAVRSRIIGGCDLVYLDGEDRRL